MPHSTLLVSDDFEKATLAFKASLAHTVGACESNDQGNFEAAREAFVDGARFYEESEKAERTEAAQLAYARILRDDGFTIKKMQQRGIDIGDAPDPLARLTESRRATEALLGLREDGGVSELNTSFRALKKITRKDKDLAFLLAEHGATVGGIGRLILRSEVEQGNLKEGRRLSRQDRRAMKAKLKDFGRDQAYGFGVLGDNAYYLTSNAMNDARAERAMGGLGGRLWAGLWMARAAVGAGYALSRNRENFTSSVLTMGRLMLDLRSRNAAIRGIRNHF